MHDGVLEPLLLLAAAVGARLARRRFAATGRGPSLAATLGALPPLSQPRTWPPSETEAAPSALPLMRAHGRARRARFGRAPPQRAGKPSELARFHRFSSLHCPCREVLAPN